MTQYPKDLIPFIKVHCTPQKRKKYFTPPPTIPEPALDQVLEVAYQASFKTEEKRRPGFRIILYSPEDHKKYTQRPWRGGKYFQNEFRLIPFGSTRQLTAAEINRLAPAAEFKRLLICVSCSDAGKPYIWALLDTGENWWKFIHHEASGGMPPPNHLTITSITAGELIVSAQGMVIATLKDSNIIQPSPDALSQGPLSDFLEPARKRLYADTIKTLKCKKWDEDGKDDRYPFRFYNFFLERILFYTRSRDHGGTILLLPDFIKATDTRISDRLNVKYSCQYSRAWDLLVSSLTNHRRYYDMHFPLWDGKKRATQALFQEYHMLADETGQIDEGLTDVAQAIAAMTAVDGAVIMDNRFNVMGFGAEVIASSPSLTEISLCSDSKSLSRSSIEAFGTRHRSAFRFCSSLEDSVAFVVSQDGGVKAVKRVGEHVVLWPDINAGSMGI